MPHATREIEDTHITSATSQKLVDELMQRGVLRLFGTQEYVPGVVMNRSGHDEEEMNKYMQARLTSAMSRAMAQYNLLGFSKSAPTDPAAPPNDRVWEATVLTIDPGADLTLTGDIPCCDTEGYYDHPRGGNDAS